MGNYHVSRDLGLRLRKFAEENCTFPETLLATLQAKLLSKNYRQAANSLAPRIERISVRRVDNQPQFYMEWTIDSKMPPLARKMIYDFLRRRRHLINASFVPDFEIAIVPNLAEQFCITYTTSDHLCLPEELSRMKNYRLNEIHREFCQRYDSLISTFSKVTIINPPEK